MKEEIRMVASDYIWTVEELEKLDESIWNMKSGLDYHEKSTLLVVNVLIKSLLEGGFTLQKGQSRE